jgi:aspartate aminotransferase-like enzyme
MPRRDRALMLSPGPVHVPAGLMADLPPLHHRSEEFKRIMIETEAMLREFLGTASSIYIFTASGTGAMEAAVANTAPAGSRALVVSGGKFGDRWAEILEAYGCRADVMRFAEGSAIPAEAVIERVSRTNPELIALTHVESSTGLLFPLPDLLRDLPSPRPVVLVDAVSSFGVEALEVDLWGIDIAIGASQKALMAPPGVSFMSMSARARELARRRQCHSYYFDVHRYAAERDNGDAPFTPAIHVVQLMHAALSRFKERGFEAVRERHRRASAAFLSAAKHLSLVSFSETPSSAVQVLVIPEVRTEIDLQAELARAGFIVAGGQGSLKGRVIRTGFLGFFGSEVLVRFTRELARILAEGGFPVDVAAAESAILAGYEEGYLF